MEKVRLNSPIQRYWRPAMSWSYLLICVFDFLIFPIGAAVFQAHFYPTGAFVHWQPITLGGGGLYHLSNLAINGTSAYGRSLEKVQALKNAVNGLPPPDVPPSTTS